MRNLQRNCREIWYANPTGENRPILDANGYDTLEVEAIFAEPMKLKCNVGTSGGQEVVEIFGSATEYQRTISFSGGNGCPLKEGCRVWFGVDSTEPNNYTVVRVADTKNTVLVALREVSKR